MIKYECRTYYSNYGTGNYFEDEDARVTKAITDEKAKAFANFFKEIGCKHYETSKAHFYEKTIDASHYEQYIIYKQ